MGDLARLWFEETALLFEFSVRRGFLEKEKTGMEAVAYVSSTLRNDSFSAVRDRTRVIPFRLWAFINVPVQVFSKGRMTEDELPLSSPS